jgi:glucose uptake protein GlcU
LGVKHGVSAWSAVRSGDSEHGLLGATLVAAMLGTMLFIATAGVDPMTYMLAGLLSSYWWTFSRLRRRALYVNERSLGMP